MRSSVRLGHRLLIKQIYLIIKEKFVIEIMTKKSKDGMVIFTLFSHTHILSSIYSNSIHTTRSEKIELYIGHI